MRIRIREVGKRICQDIKNFWPAAVAVVICIVLMNVLFGAFCPMVVITGLPCPGCGMTRSLFFLITGRLERSLWIHPMGILIAGIIFYFLWNRYLLGKSARGMKTLIILAIAALVFFYLFRMYLYFPDREPYVYREENLLARVFPFYEQILHALGML